MLENALYVVEVDTISLESLTMRCTPKQTALPLLELAEDRRVTIPLHCTNTHRDPKTLFAAMQAGYLSAQALESALKKISNRKT